MSEFTKLYNEMPLVELIAEHDRLRRDIGDNDGRLSTGSSADLDYLTDQQEEVGRKIAERIGLFDLWRNFNRLDSDHSYRLQTIERRLRLGQSSQGHYEFLDGYLTIAPLRLWVAELKFGLINPLLRGEKPHWVGWEPGIWIFRNLPGIKPGRWGFGVLGIEVGSRSPDDPVGVWLKKVGLWPW